MEKEKHNNFLKTYIYHQDCLIYNESINRDKYTLKVTNNYYELYDVNNLKINSSIECFISPNSTIAYLNIDLEPYRLVLIFLLICMLGLFITGSLLKICVETDIIKIEDKKFKSKISNLVLNSIQEENNLINSNNNLYTNHDINNETTILIDRNDLPKFYDISLIRDEYEESLIDTQNNNSNNNSPSNIKCNICIKPTPNYIKICLQPHYFCRGCIINIDKDICIICQKSIIFKDVKIIS